MQAGINVMHLVIQQSMHAIIACLYTLALQTLLDQQLTEWQQYTQEVYSKLCSTCLTPCF